MLDLVLKNSAFVIPFSEMADASRMQKALEMTNKATTLDSQGKFAEALEAYEACLRQWMFVYKYDNNPSRQAVLEPQLKSYIERAEELRERLKQSTPAAEASNSSSNPEKSQLTQALQSAIVKEKPNVKWDDVAGLKVAKQTLQETVLLPVKFPQMFTGNRKPWKGILLYGPPGTGKSYLAKACATEAEATFFSISSSSLVSKWLGESEKLVKTLFEMARAEPRAIIFIDEVDSLCGSRDSEDNESSRRIKTELLVQMDGIGSGGQVLVLGATNCPWDLDPAIRRRFERRVFIPLPEIEARRRMAELAIGNTPHSLTAKNLETLAVRTEGFSGADINVLVRDALMQPVRRCASSTHFKKVGNSWTPCSAEDPDPTKEKRGLLSISSDQLLAPVVTWQDLEIALGNARSSVGQEDVKRQEEWTSKFGMEG